MVDKKKSDNLNLVIEQIKKQTKDPNAIMRLGDGKKLIKDIDVISTGSISLNTALGIGGLPKGRIVEIYGPESSGKTTLTLHAIAEAQKNKGIAAFIDVEHALDPVYTKNIGVDMDSLLISQPDTGEQALDIVETLIRSGAIDVIVVDSVAALTPEAEIEGEMGDTHVGLLPRLMSKALRKISGVTNKSKTCVIFTNQIRQKIGVMFGNPNTTPGGLALKFHASVRLEIKRAETLKDGSDAIGSRTKVKVVKNKVAPPFIETEFDIVFGEGISKEGDLIDVGIDREIVRKSGAWFYYGDERLGQGKAKAIGYLKENLEIASEIEAKIRQTLNLTGKPADISDEVDVTEEQEAGLTV